MTDCPRGSWGTTCCGGARAELLVGLRGSGLHLDLLRRAPRSWLMVNSVPSTFGKIRHLVKSSIAQHAFMFIFDGKASMAGDVGRHTPPGE